MSLTALLRFTADDFADFASKTMMVSCLCSSRRHVVAKLTWSQIAAPGYLGTALGTDIIMASLMTFFLYQEYRRGHYEGYVRYPAKYTEVEFHVDPCPK